MMKTVSGFRYEKLPTEQNNPRSRAIDSVSIRKVLSIIQSEDASVPNAVAKVLPSIEKAVKMIVPALRNGGRLFFAGAGTSGRLGVLEAAECPPTFGTDPEMIQAVMAGGNNAVFKSKEGSEDRYEESLKLFSKKLRAGDILVGIAASGVTPFVLAAFKAAKKKKLKTILVTCNPKPVERSLIDCVIAPAVGAEVITGSTRLKAGTATKLVLNMITVTSMIQLGKVYQNWMVDVQPNSKKLISRALRLVEKLGEVTPDESKKIFAASGHKTKTAIVMAKSGVSQKTAEGKLKSAAGYLHRIFKA